MVDTKSLAVSTPRSLGRSLGAEYVCHSMWQKLDFAGLLTRSGIPQSTPPLLKALVLGRLISLGSELWTRKWAEELSAIYELTGMPPNHCLQSSCRGTDRLYECKFLTMGLIVDGQGFEKYSKLYQGNQYEADTFQKIIEEMEKHRRRAKKGTIVMDAGIATEANITWLKEPSHLEIYTKLGLSGRPLNHRLLKRKIGSENENNQAVFQE